MSTICEEFESCLRVLSHAPDTDFFCEEETFRRRPTIFQWIEQEWPNSLSERTLQYTCEYHEERTELSFHPSLLQDKEKIDSYISFDKHGEYSYSTIESCVLENCYYCIHTSHFYDGRYKISHCSYEVYHAQDLFEEARQNVIKQAYSLQSQRFWATPEHVLTHASQAFPDELVDNLVRILPPEIQHKLVKAITKAQHDT